MSQTKRTVTPLRIALLLAVLIGVYYFLPQLGSFRRTFTVLGQASWPWLVVGLLASSASFLAGAVTQFAAGNLTGSFSDLARLQFAGSFVNHFLPFSLGGINLTTRYYKKRGARQAEALTMATIPVIFGVITTIVIVALVSPITLAQFAGHLHVSHLSAWLALLIAGVVVLGLLAAVKYRRRARKLLAETVAGLKGIGGWRQVVLLVAGSVGITATMSLALLASSMAVHASVGLASVFVMYVTISLVGNVAPTPDGIGATEAVLVLALVATGLSLPQAAAVTFIYRFLTFWLPLIPGGLALRRLNQRKVI